MTTERFLQRLAAAAATHHPVDCPSLLRPDTAEDPALLLTRFDLRFRALGPAGETTLARFDTPQALRAELDQLLCGIAEDDRRLHAEWRDTGFCSVGITGADALLADTGSVVLEVDGPRRGHASLLVRHQIVITSTECLMTDLAQYTEGRDPRDRRTTVIITGPSRTADIEKMLVIPAHGPQRMSILLVGRRSEADQLLEALRQRTQ